MIHEQQNSIDKQVENLNFQLNNTKIGIHTVHTAPLIRKEKIYTNLDISDRFKIFDKLFHFTRNVKIKYTSIIVDKKHKNSFDINNSISRELSFIIKDNLAYFQQFDDIIIYYDNGQNQLANILISVFSSWFHEKFKYRVVNPNEYKLFQTADLICTLSLLQHKLSCKQSMTKSETKFFGTYRNLKINYLKHLKKLEF